MSSQPVSEKDFLLYLVAEDLATMMGRAKPRIDSVSAAKGLSFERTRDSMQRTLRSFGLSAAEQNRLLLQTLPSLFAALVNAESTRKEMPESWRRDMLHASARYISARAPFSLNLMNIGLNLAQYALFSGCAMTGHVLDLGSGNGYVSNIILEPAKSRTVLSDVLPSGLVQAKRYGFREIVGVDMHALPYADESFDTIVSIHSVDNAGQRDRTLREAFRVLRPGGQLFFTDFLSNFFEARPLPSLLNALAMQRLAREYRDYAARYSIDSTDREGLSLSDYKALVQTIGFDVERATTFFGGLLFRYCYLGFDWELALRDDSIWRYRPLHAKSIANLYGRISADVLLPEIFSDLSTQDASQTQVFFHLRKPGSASPNAAPPELVCIKCKSALRPQEEHLVCVSCGAKYPVINEIPLVFASAKDAFDAARSAKRNLKQLARMILRRVRDRIV